MSPSVVTKARELLEGSRALSLVTRALTVVPLKVRVGRVSWCSDFIGGIPNKGLAQSREWVIARVRISAEQPGRSPTSDSGRMDREHPGFGDHLDSPGEARLHIVAEQFGSGPTSDISRTVREWPWLRISAEQFRSGPASDAGRSSPDFG